MRYITVDSMCPACRPWLPSVVISYPTREGICALHYNMVQNAIETHKLLMAIAEWQMKQLSASTVASPGPKEKDQAEVSASTELPSSSGGDGGCNGDDGGGEEEEEVKETHKLEQGATGSVLSVNEITLTSPELMEPVDVAQARAELATLVADKQRMEAHQRRLHRKLQESNKQLEEVQEVSSARTHD